MRSWEMWRSTTKEGLWVRFNSESEPHKPMMTSGDTTRHHTCLTHVVVRSGQFTTHVWIFLFVPVSPLSSTLLRVQVKTIFSLFQKTNQVSKLERKPSSGVGKVTKNEWVLIITCKQLVWSTRIDRNMPIWILCLILGSGPGADLPLEVTGPWSRVISTWSPRYSVYSRLHTKRRHPDSQNPHL
jgi:hypothetical protein